MDIWQCLYILGLSSLVILFITVVYKSDNLKPDKYVKLEEELKYIDQLYKDKTITKEEFDRLHSRTFFELTKISCSQYKESKPEWVGDSLD